MIPIPLSWGGRQLWGVNQKKRRRHPPTPNSASLPNAPLLYCAIVHYSQPQCQDLQLLTLLHKTTDTSSMHPSTPHLCICVFYYLSSVPWVLGGKMGNWVLDFCPSTASSKFWRKWELSHFGGNRKHKKREPPRWILLVCRRERCNSTNGDFKVAHFGHFKWNMCAHHINFRLTY